MILLLRCKNFIWPVGEAVNTQGSQPCIHGFETRTGYHLKIKAFLRAFFIF